MYIYEVTKTFSFALDKKNKAKLKVFALHVTGNLSDF
jgi:hypothetical protein